MWKHPERPYRSRLRCCPSGHFVSNAIAAGTRIDMAGWEFNSVTTGTHKVTFAGKVTRPKKQAPNSLDVIV